jgi:hypothetical protein
MSVELLESIKRQAEALTPQEKSRLATHLLEQAKLDTAKLAAPVNEEIAQLRRMQHMEWLKGHSEEFGGQYVALEGDQLICTGRTFREASEAARALGKPDVFFVYLPKPD